MCMWPGCAAQRHALDTHHGEAVSLSIVLLLRTQACSIAPVDLAQVIPLLPEGADVNRLSKVRARPTTLDAVIAPTDSVTVGLCLLASARGRPS
jgi:hypothetical protein